MVDAFEDLEFAARLAHACGTGLVGGGGRDGVDADTAMNRVDADVLCFPILKPFTLGQQLAQPVVAHLAVLVGGADAGLSEAASDGARLLRVDGGRRAVRDAVGQRPDDPRVVQGTGSATLKGGRLGQPFEPTGQAGGREKDRWLDEGQADLGLGDGRLPLEQTGQALGFAIGEDDRVVDSRRSAIGRPGPAVHIAGQHARAALDLDEEQTGRRKDQRIDLADLALVVDELEVGPDVPGVAVGQLASKPVERLSLPREVGLGDDVPAGGAQRHGFTSRPSCTYSNRSPTWQLNSRQSCSMAGRSTRVVVSL